MNDPRRTDAIVTPEAVFLNVDVAGLGSRMIAAVIDSLIQGALLLLFFLVFVPAGSAAGISGAGGVAVIAVVVFAIVWGYFPLFEGLYSGRTPGKRAQRLRVMQADGQPAGFGPIAVRNLLRIVDFLPAYYAAGVITILATPRSQRIGDLVAGTIVVRDRRAPQPAVAPDASPIAASMAARLDTTGLTEREYDVARSFLQRRASLDPAARANLAARIAGTLRERVPDVAGGARDDEEFVEAVVRSYRDRFAGGSPTHSERSGGDGPPAYGPL